jgi:hypothetical protein
MVDKEKTFEEFLAEFKKTINWKLSKSDEESLKKAWDKLHEAGGRLVIE